MPDITTDDNSVTFAFDLLEPLDARLVLRCDGRGEVFASIPDPTPRPPYPFTAAGD